MITKTELITNQRAQRRVYARQRGIARIRLIGNAEFAQVLRDCANRIDREFNLITIECSVGVGIAFTLRALSSAPGCAAP